MPTLTRRALLAAVAALLTLAAWPGAPGAQRQQTTNAVKQLPEADEETTALVRRVIEAQLSAFQADDGETAFRYAAPELQQRFETPERFMRMVQGAYPQVYRARQWAFRAARQGAPTRVVQPMLIEGPRGDTVLTLYRMERQGADGPWRIAGVVMVPVGRGGV